MDQPFRNRREAGRRLARQVEHLKAQDPVVLALPRGGVPVAFEVAGVLGAPLDVFVVRKLGVPGREELAMGAIASGGAIVVNRDVLEVTNVPSDVVQDVARWEFDEVLRREAAYRGDQPPLCVAGRTVLMVDDGLATGATMRAAVTAVRMAEPTRLIVAVPVAAPAACRSLADVADEVICAQTPERFQAVGQWYRDFEQVSDQEVQTLLHDHRQRLVADVSMQHGAAE